VKAFPVNVQAILIIDVLLLPPFLLFTLLQDQRKWDRKDGEKVCFFLPLSSLTELDENAADDEGVLEVITKQSFYNKVMKSVTIPEVIYVLLFAICC
jgi:hypothetical protein